jgi:hypothetical protein
MKKIIFSLFLLLTSFLFGAIDSYPEYVTEVKKVEYEEADYNIKIQLEGMLTQDGTLGNSVVRIAHSLKALQEHYPKANWFFFQTYDESGKEFWTGSIKIKGVNLQNKSDNYELVKEVVKNWNIMMHPEDRERINKFISDGYIPMF